MTYKDRWDAENRRRHQRKYNTSERGKAQNRARHKAFRFLAAKYREEFLQVKELFLQEELQSVRERERSSNEVNESHARPLSS